MKYPSGTKTENIKKTISTANRGMSLEEDLNLTNRYYLDNNVAVIHKKATPIKAMKVKYDNSSKKITDGFFEIASTTDYNGIYKGYHIDFEAKCTNSKTSFPMSNIHEHQLNHLKKIREHGGISFLIIRFTSLNETFLLECDKLFDIIKDRKSIPIAHIKNYGYLIKENYQPRLDYIKIVDLILGGKDEV